MQCCICLENLGSRYSAVCGPCEVYFADIGTPRDHRLFVGRKGADRLRELAKWMEENEDNQDCEELVAEAFCNLVSYCTTRHVFSEESDGRG